MNNLNEIKKEKEFVSDFMYIQRLEEYCEELEKQVEYWRINYYVKAELAHEFSLEKDFWLRCYKTLEKSK